MQHRFPPPRPARRLRKTKIVAIVAAVVAALTLLVLSIAALGMDIIYHARILPNVSVAGHQLSGLAPHEAAELLLEELPALSCQTLTVDMGVDQVELSAADIGRTYAAREAADAAYEVGREHGFPLAAFDRLWRLVAPVDVPVAVTPYREAGVAYAAEMIAADFGRPAAEAEVFLLSNGRFGSRPGEVGRGLVPASLLSAVAAEVSANDPDCVVQPVVGFIVPLLTTEEAEAAVEAARRIIAAPIELQVDDVELEISAELLHKNLAFVTDDDGNAWPQIDTTALRTAVEALDAEVEREPVDAEFTLAARGVAGVEPGRDGLALQVDDTLAAVAAEIASRAAGNQAAMVEISVERTPPALSTEAAEATFAEMSLISSWTTKFTPSDGNGFGANIHIGARDLDGYVLLPGETLDFWDAIGPVTTERGYSAGGVIIDGRSVAGGAIGGGICSTSTTLFNAALRAGLDIGSRDNHAYYIDRYPVGLDATVWQTESAEQTMSFSNDTEHPIVIRAVTAPGSVSFELWSVDPQREVSIGDAVISDRAQADDLTEVDPGLAPGQSVRAEFPHDGFTAEVTWRVTDADGKVLHDRTFISDYRVVNGITRVGPMPPPSLTPAPSPPPSPAPTSTPSPRPSASPTPSP